MPRKLPEVPQGLSPSEVEIVEFPEEPVPAENQLRVPRAGELVLITMTDETDAMIRTGHYRIFKGTVVGSIIRSAQSVIWKGRDGLVEHEVEVEGGELMRVRMVRSPEPQQPWIWDRVTA